MLYSVNKFLCVFSVKRLKTAQAVKALYKLLLLLLCVCVCVYMYSCVYMRARACLFIHEVSYLCRELSVAPVYNETEIQ